MSTNSIRSLYPTVYELKSLIAIDGKLILSSAHKEHPELIGKIGVLADRILINMKNSVIHDDVIYADIVCLKKEACKMRNVFMSLAEDAKKKNNPSKHHITAVRNELSRLIAVIDKTTA